MSDNLGDTAAYNQWLMGRVIDPVLNGERNLSNIIAAAQGADPSTVWCALQFAVSSGQLEKNMVDLIDRGCCREDDYVIEPLLPPAHPLDFEWRFSRCGAEYLLARVPNQKHHSMCLVGATTVAICAARQGWQGGLVALDANQLVLKYARGLHPQLDIVPLDVTRDDLPDIRVDIVVTDPPWYPEYIMGFLWTSARLCAPGGKVLLVIPGEGTRPNIFEERANMLRVAASYGLEIVEIEPQVIAFETPLFERNALRAAGISSPPRFWRRGDLVVFSRTKVSEGSRPKPPSGFGSWEEVAFGGSRIRFRRKDGSPGCFPRLKSIFAGDILPSISRRDSRRSQVDVWTSGNRVYACESPDVLRVIAQSAVDGRSVISAVEAFLGRGCDMIETVQALESSDTMARLIKLESEEQAEYDRGFVEEKPRSI